MRCLQCASVNSSVKPISSRDNGSDLFNNCHRSAVTMQADEEHYSGFTSDANQRANSSWLDNVTLLLAEQHITLR